MKGQLVLESGEVFEGTLVGANHRQSIGEVVFSTALTGYQETLSDPSYCEQILVCTTPHIGNIGINPWDMESQRVQISGLVVQSLCEAPSSWRSHGNLSQWLEDAGVPLLTGVETRRLTLRLRDEGVIKGWVGTQDITLERVKELLRDSPDMKGRDLISVVTASEPYRWDKGSSDLFNQPVDVASKAKAKLKVAVLDFGIKFSILRQLVDHGLELMVFPAKSKASDILNFEPDGIFLSNGPGDPTASETSIELIRELLGVKPIFGICMGHQLLSLALGAKTFKMPFGHRGINHPVRNCRTGHVEMTSHNHGFAVDGKSLPAGIECTHISLNDETVEGIRCVEKKAFGVQYHPESFPGPHDSGYLFKEFVESMQP